MELIESVYFRWTLRFFALFIAVFATHFGKFETADNINTDIYHIIRGERYQPKSTLIVSLDSESMGMFPYTPLAFWGPNFAKVIERLRNAGALSIALDFQYLITPEQWLSTLSDEEDISTQLINYDQSFDQALHNGKVILGAKPIRNKFSTIVVDPPLEYLEALLNHREGIGLTYLVRDSGSIVRKYVPAQASLKSKSIDTHSIFTQAYKTPDPWWTLAALAVKEGFGENYLESFKDNSALDNHLISYCGPPGTINRLSMAVFLRDKELKFEEKELIADRIIFIGADEEHFGDRQRTPYSRQIFGLGYRDMNSIEIHANIAETILQNGHIKVIPLWLTAIIWSPFVFAGIYLSEKYEFIKSLKIVDIVIAFIIWIIGLACFWNNYILNQAGLAFAMFIYFFFFYFLRSIRKKCLEKNI